MISLKKRKRERERSRGQTLNLANLGFPNCSRSLRWDKPVSPCFAWLWSRFWSQMDGVERVLHVTSPAVETSLRLHTGALYRVNWIQYSSTSMSGLAVCLGRSKEAALPRLPSALTIRCFIKLPFSTLWACWYDFLRHTADFYGQLCSVASGRERGAFGCLWRRRQRSDLWATPSPHPWKKGQDHIRNRM